MLGLPLVLCTSIVLTFILVISVHCSNKAYNLSTYAQLQKDLLSREPVANRVSPRFASPTGTFNVTYRSMLLDVLDIDQVKQVMTICLYLKIKWKQDYLSWIPENYNNFSSIDMDTRSLWTPKLIVTVGYYENLHLDIPESAIVDWSGTVSLHTETYITFRCAVDFRKYPFDIQECKLGIVAMVTYDKTVIVNYEASQLPKDQNHYVTDGEWQLLNTWWEITRDDTLQNHPSFFLRVRRRSAYYVITVISPLVLTSAMISFVFLIPTKTGEKIAYFVALYTSLTIFLNFVSNVMPRNLSSAPYLVLLLVGVILQGVLSTLAALFVVNRYEKDKNKKTSFCLKCRLATLRRHKVAPQEDVPPDLKEFPEISNSGVECTEVNPQVTPSAFYISSSQWDKLFFALFSSAEVVWLGALFGATDWLSDASLF